MLADSVFELELHPLLWDALWSGGRTFIAACLQAGSLQDTVFDSLRVRIAPRASLGCCLRLKDPQLLVRIVEERDCARCEAAQRAPSSPSSPPR